MEKFLDLIEKHGFAAVSALILMIFVGSTIVNALTRIDTKLDTIQLQGRVLEQICINTAHTEAERAACRIRPHDDEAGR